MIKILRQLELLFPVSGRTKVSAAKNRERSRSRATRRLLQTDGCSHQGSGDTRIGHDALQAACGASRHPDTNTAGKSDEFLLTLWLNLRREFFPEHPDVDNYVVTWSTRPQRRVLASCNIRRRRIVVAQELFEPSATRWIAPVLYHEMCHAVIGEGVHLSQSGKRLWHGRQFRQLEALHPDIEAMNAWIATGGWAMAVRSHRARRSWRSRRGSH